ncbi:MAG: indolepyruvate ferredoxin oxidoreductase family protein [Pseudomonadota bacterium]
MSVAKNVSLGDKFDLGKERVFLSGTQALVRLALAQQARDAATGHNTAGYITGYRGSPLGAVDQQFMRAERTLGGNIIFQPAINEDLAATAVWGTQTAHLTGENRHDGVFAIWYGKGPGVDRSGDALRHANLAGTAPLGGVLALMGDDHTCESSTTAHQSEFGMINAMIPILSPAGVQDIVDYGLLGIAMSRYAGTWVGVKLVKDTVESTASIDGRPDRAMVPKMPGPAPDVHIRQGFDALGQEARLMEVKLPAAQAFVHAAGLNPITVRGKSPTIGLVATGKSWLDTLSALDQLGLDEVGLANAGVRLMKVGCPWPLPAADVRAFADGLQTIIVVEEKRALIEPQIKDVLYGTANAPTVIGKTDEHGKTLFPAPGALESHKIAVVIGERLVAAGRTTLEGALSAAKDLDATLEATTAIGARKPYFCAGCPHSTSTVVPEGARAAAGIGCHFMALWMDRDTEGFTQMGGEGAQWIGEAPFSKRPHLFQNIGDGTYNHSGSLAIRAAVAAGVNITYKILYNDAVAMTGGQTHDGDLTVADIVAQMQAEGVAAVAVVAEEPARHGRFPGVTLDHRDDLMEVQKRLSEIPGVTVLVYDQTCASEKRRRRKRGQFPDPDMRLVINERVCEGCGDCGVQSNCVALQPLETAFGRKRMIDQSVCNKDTSCVKGFCPSFVTVHGARVRTAKTPDIDAALPDPARPALDGPMGILVTGVGGTGVVTVGAVIGMAAHLEGLGAGIIDMAGLAQKGGAVTSHIKLAPKPEDIATIRIGPGGAAALLACDVVVAGGAKVLAAVAPGAPILVNTHEQLPGDFTRDIDFSLPTRRIVSALGERGRVHALNASQAAKALFGDAIFANTLVLGAAYQSGALPLSGDNLEAAIRLNGAAVDKNLAAFRAGRLMIADRAHFDSLVASARPKNLSHRAVPETLDARLARYATSLTAYQNVAHAARFERRIAALSAAGASPKLLDLAALQLYRLMSVKDEYEVARLYADGAFTAQLSAEFSSWDRIEVHLSPPLLSREDPRTGRPEKRRFPGWLTRRLFPTLARMKRLRGTPLDPFARTHERREDRALLKAYEATLDDLAARLPTLDAAAALALASWPVAIKGYGPVRAKNVEKARAAKAAAEAAATTAAADTTPARTKATALAGE